MGKFGNNLGNLGKFGKFWGYMFFNVLPGKKFGTTSYFFWGIWEILGILGTFGNI
jgi:hypothetical protein